MSKEMNKLILNMIKYDLIVGFVFWLILITFITPKVAHIFSLGLIVSLLNAIISGRVLEYSLRKNKKVFLLLSYITRITLIIIIAFPFLNDLIQLVAYLAGYLLHFVVVTFYWTKAEKGSD